MASGPPHIPLADLLTRAAAGDEQAWASLVRAYTPRLFGLIVRQTGDRDLAEEIAQQTFVKLVSLIGSDQGYQEQGRFESWLFRIAINVLRDEMRRRGRQARPTDMSDADGEGMSAAPWSRRPTAGPGDVAPPLEKLTHLEQIAQLQQAMTTLGQADREILHLRHTAGLSFPQIAQSLGQPLGTVLARAHRAVAKLRKVMQE